MRRIRFIALFSMSLLLSGAAAYAGKRVAFVIGIDKYDNLAPHAQLSKARSDAAAVARVLKDIGFDVIFKEDVTRAEFNSNWQDFLNKLTRGDTAAFYFAGHGVEFAGHSYLIPRDVPNLKPGRDELLRREALSLQEFLMDLRERGTRLNLVILDACRDNPFQQVAERSIGSRRGLAVAEPPPEGSFIMYSAGAGQSALDRLNDTDRNPNSVYTRHLLPLLETPGLSLTEIAEQVRVSVWQLASTVQHRQMPAYYNQVLGRVCLAGGSCAQHGASVPEAAKLNQAATAKAKAEVEAARAKAEAEIASAEAARLKARSAMELAKAEAEREAAQLAKLRAEADLARVRAEAEMARVRAETELARMHAEKQKQALLRPPDQNPAHMPGTVAPVVPTDAIETVRSFYVALGRADGIHASSFVVPEKRASGPLSATEITRFFGSLTEPLRLANVISLGSDRFRVAYTFRKPNGSWCYGSAEVTTTRRDGRALIQGIKANC